MITTITWVKVRSRYRGDKEYGSVDYAGRTTDTMRGVIRSEAYHLGILPPRYPMPSLLGATYIMEAQVLIRSPRDTNYCYWW